MLLLFSKWTKISLHLSTAISWTTITSSQKQTTTGLNPVTICHMSTTGQALTSINQHITRSRQTTSHNTTGSHRISTNSSLTTTGQRPLLIINRNKQWLFDIGILLNSLSHQSHFASKKLVTIVSRHLMSPRCRAHQVSLKQLYLAVIKLQVKSHWSKCQLKLNNFQNYHFQIKRF